MCRHIGSQPQMRRQLTLAHILSARKRHVKCLIVAPLSSKASLEKTEAMAAKNPAVTARENPTPNIPHTSNVERSHCTAGTWTKPLTAHARVRRHETSRNPGTELETVRIRARIKSDVLYIARDELLNVELRSGKVNVRRLCDGCIAMSYSYLFKYIIIGDTGKMQLAPRPSRVCIR